MIGSMRFFLFTVIFIFLSCRNDDPGHVIDGIDYRITSPAAHTIDLTLTNLTERDTTWYFGSGCQTGWKISNLIFADEGPDACTDNLTSLYLPAGQSHTLTLTGNWPTGTYFVELYLLQPGAPHVQDLVTID